jgi:hypothetical protein
MNQLTNLEAVAEAAVKHAASEMGSELKQSQVGLGGSKANAMEHAPIPSCAAAAAQAATVGARSATHSENA